MVILFPIGRKTTLNKFPWFTIGLITFNLFIFILTWPSEKRFLNERVSYNEFSSVGHKLLDILVSNDSGIPQNTKLILKKQKNERNFPTLFINEIFQSIDNKTLTISPNAQYRWELIYPRYLALKRSLEKSNGSHYSIFFNYGFSCDTPLFPNILTHQFLHAGILHLFFNMFFLWLVGCNVEECLGPIIFLCLYLFGGMAAALVQIAFYPNSDLPLIGASGAVASIMGAFLIRHSSMRIRVFYLIFFFISARFGVFEMPAWLALPLWFFQQLFMGLMTVKYSPQVGYFAHAGGFMLGVIGGILINTFHLSKHWEELAEQTLPALDLKIEKGFSHLFLNELEDAEKIFKEVIAVYPMHIKARKGLIQLYEQTDNKIRFCEGAVELMKVALDTNNIILVNDILDRTKIITRGTELNDFFLFKLASFYEKAKRWEEAIQVYSQIIEKYTKSLYLAKSLFSLGKILKEQLHRPEEAKQYFEKLTHPPYDLEWSTMVKEYLKD